MGGGGRERESVLGGHPCHSPAVASDEQAANLHAQHRRLRAWLDACDGDPAVSVHLVHIQPKRTRAKGEVGRGALRAGYGQREQRAAPRRHRRDTWS